MFKKLLLSLTVVVGGLTASQGANFLINISGMPSSGAGGALPAPAGSMLIGVASTTDAVFAAPTPGDFLGGSADDVILFTKALTGPGSLTGTSGDIKFAAHANFNAGDPIRLVWFPATTPDATAAAPPTFTPPAAGPSGGDWYGVTDVTVTMANDTDAFNATTFNYGDVSGAHTMAQVLPIPEPTAPLLLGLGMSLLFLRRRHGGR